MKIVIVVPTLNPGDAWKEWVSAVKLQSMSVDVVVVDSSSDDLTCDIAEESGFHVVRINREVFNHGGTRQSVVEQLKDCDVVIFLTQDAILFGVDSLQNIIKPFVDENVAAVCGRQLPNKNATAIAAHARLYNYPKQSNTRDISDKKDMGLKAAFLSNSYAAYRVSALNAVGGFPGDVIFGEDMCVAAKLLLANLKISYAADASVFHSHNYTMVQEFKRYFDMGVFHASQPWIRRELGSAESEGRKFILSEMAYLIKHEFWMIPEAFMRATVKYLGFRLGRIERKLPLTFKVACSMNKGYFKNK